MSLITGHEEPKYNICVADIPVAAKITIVLTSGRPLIDQIVVKNYGGSLMVSDCYGVQIISRLDIRYISLTDKATLRMLEGK